ncbi:MAG: hypothetical protein R3A80_04485 [Bdellovibrionota bacterium]
MMYVSKLLMFLLSLIVFLQDTKLEAQMIQVKAYKTRLSDVMDDIGTQSRKKIVLNTEENPLISFGSKEASLQDTLKKIENLYGYSFKVDKGAITVNAPDKKGGRSIASLEDAADATPMELRESGYRFRTVNMNYQDPSLVVKQIKLITGEDIKFLDVDTKNNAVVFYGDEQTYRLVRQIADDVDVSPPQVLLSARVVEVTSSFSKDLGVALSREPGTNKGDITSPNGGSGANFTLGYKFGIIDSTGLSATLNAGESNGDAKTLSSPQVITSDGIAANISSDNTINVKIGTTGSSTDSSGATAGSLQSVTAGLKLDVTPKVLRDGRLRLKLNITNSQFDDTRIDGVPGQTSTAVQTEMIMKTGQTASIAGLYKKQSSDKSAGVPLAMHVPLFGWLFKSNSKSDTRQEVMAFITPSIIDMATEKSINLDNIKLENDKNDKKLSSR